MEPAVARRMSRLTGVSAILGVLMILYSFGINQGPPLDATDDQMMAYAHSHFRHVMVASWLQSVGPLLIVIFALALVRLASATNSLMGWLTLLGASILMMVSLSEVVFYICALDSAPPTMGRIGNNVGHAIQHLYFIVAAPVLFIPLGSVLMGSRILPKAFGVLAVFIGVCFFILGITSLYQPILSVAVTSFAPIQALWWLAAGIALIRRSGRIDQFLAKS